MATEVPHVYQAITAVTAKMAKDGLSKSKTNSQQGYKFRGIDDLYNAIAAVLAANNLCMLPRVTDRKFDERTTKSGAVLNYTILTVEFDLVSSLDGSKHTIVTIGEAMDSADKSGNKAMSAAMKYACLVAFQIPTEGDNDADATTPDLASRKKTEKVVEAKADDIDRAVESYVSSIEKADDMKALMGIYASCQSDAGLPQASKTYVQACLTAKRKLVEGKAA